MVLFRSLFPFRKVTNNKDPKKLSTSVKAFSLLLIVLIATVISLPILQPTQVAAEGPVTSSSVGYNNPEAIDWQIKSLLYYNTIKSCASYTYLPSQASWWIDKDNADKGSWFRNGTRESSGVYTRDDLITNGNTNGIIGTTSDPEGWSDWDGRVMCDNPSFIKSAMTLWQLSAAEILCNSDLERVGLTRNKVPTAESIAICINPVAASGTDLNYTPDGGAWDNGSGDSIKKMNSVAFAAYIQKMIYGGAEPTLPGTEYTNDNTSAYNTFDGTYDHSEGALWYIFYRHTLDQSCIPGIDSASHLDNVQDAAKNYTNIIWVADDGTITDPASFGGALAGDHKVNLGPIYGALDDDAMNELTCQQIADKMTSYSKSYQTFIDATLASPPVQTVPTGSNNNSFGR